MFKHNVTPFKVRSRQKAAYPLDGDVRAERLRHELLLQLLRAERHLEVGALNGERAAVLQEPHDVVFALCVQREDHRAPIAGPVGQLVRLVEGPKFANSSSENLWTFLRAYSKISARC